MTTGGGAARGPRIGSYGAWSSPITAATVAEQSGQLADPRLDGDDVYWLEGRPLERGRTVIVVRDRNGERRDVTPPEFDVRSRVHEYGGGAYAVAGGVVHFVNKRDQQVYRQRNDGSPPVRLTRDGQARYADLRVDAVHRRLLAVKERHSERAGEEPVNTLIAIALAAGVETLLAGGDDFYASPALSPDGSQLAWLSWSHPKMPWIGTSLHLATLDAAGAVVEERIIAGDGAASGGGEESIFQPEWSPDGRLVFVSDRDGFWNLHRWTGTGAENLLPRAAEFGVAQWQFGFSTYAFASARTIVHASVSDGVWRLGTLDVETGANRELPGAFSTIADVRTSATHAVIRCATPTSFPALAFVDLASGELTPFAQTAPPERCAALAAHLSTPEPITFATSEGESAHAFFYPPHNPDWRAPAGEEPPLIVKTHGGPTSAATSALNLSVQFWTSRGFAVLDVNYRGSTGYGRRYRERLDGRWGVFDVDDCVAGARALVAAQRVDGDRLLITGGSAGGYTTLCALTFSDAFAGGASYYGIGDLVALVTETHKFESRYLETLIGPYRPDSALYRDRSPINFVERLSAPVIFFQGAEDRVVPPDQATTMHGALLRRGISTALLIFDGEQHGFRDAEHVRQAIEAELLFYATEVLRVPLNVSGGAAPG